MLIDNHHIEKLSLKLKDILEAEIKAGNKVCETYIGDWPYPNSTMIFLKKPFKTKILKSVPGVEYRLVNDPHYWKAEYRDLDDNSLLCCKFDGPNFDPL